MDFYSSQVCVYMVHLLHMINQYQKSVFEFIEEALENHYVKYCMLA